MIQIQGLQMYVWEEAGEDLFDMWGHEFYVKFTTYNKIPTTIKDMQWHQWNVTFLMEQTKKHDIVHRVFNFQKVTNYIVYFPSANMLLFEQSSIECFHIDEASETK